MVDDSVKSLAGHLNELRRGLIICVIAVAVGLIISFFLADRLFKILTWPVEGVNLIFVEVTEMLGAYMQVCLAAGIILAMPVLVYQLLMFVSPALTPKEKKYVWIVLPWIIIFFAGGVLFGYYVLIPPAMQFLVSFGADIATPQIRIGNYISLVTRLLLIIGLIFETPVITTLLARLGIISARGLLRQWKWAVILAFVLGAAITPTWDPVNQTLVALPLIVLYLLSILLARLVERHSKDKTATESA